MDQHPLNPRNSEISRKVHYMIEWMYSEPPGADPRTSARTSGHIGQSWTGVATSWTGQIYKKQTDENQFSGILFFTKVKNFARAKN